MTTCPWYMPRLFSLVVTLTTTPSPAWNMVAMGARTNMTVAIIPEPMQDQLYSPKLTGLDWNWHRLSTRATCGPDDSTFAPWLKAAVAPPGPPTEPVAAITHTHTTQPVAAAR